MPLPQKDAPQMPSSPAEHASAPGFLPPQAGEPTPWVPASEAGAPKDASHPVDEAFRQQTANLQTLPVRLDRVGRGAAFYAVGAALKRIVPKR